MKSEDLEVYKYADELKRNIAVWTINFPKSIKYSYGEDLINYSSNLISYISLANSLVNDIRIRILVLCIAQSELEKLKTTKRTLQFISSKINSLSTKQFESFDILLGIIEGKLVSWKMNILKSADTTNVKDLSGCFGSGGTNNLLELILEILKLKL